MLAVLHRIVGFLIGTNLYIGLVATAVAAPGILVFNSHYKWINLCFALSSTVLAYNIQRYFKWRTGNMPVFLNRYAFSQKIWIMIIALPACISIGLFFFMRPFHQWLIAGITGITGLYLFINPRSGQLSGLRFIPFAKTIVVAFCWTTLFFVVCTPPDFVLFLKWHWVYWLVVFLQVWQSCVLFDLRDIEVDRVHGVKTFANVLGTLPLFLLWLMMSAGIFTLFFFPGHPNYVYALGLYVFAWVLQLICLFRPGMNGIWFTFLLDGSLVPLAAGNYLLMI